MTYPAGLSARDRFVLDHRPVRPAVDPWSAPTVVVEPERAASGEVVDVATLFLVGRECPWRCVMCDLWRHTTTEDTPLGAIPVQVQAAMSGLPSPRPRVVKLYNAGSFFDPRAVPDEDYDAIAAALDGTAHVIVESHPALIGPRVDWWLAAMQRQARGPMPTLEVAVGLETAHPDALARLNKRITRAQFEEAAEGLRARGVALRVFLLVSPPFVPLLEHEAWLLRSVDLAFECGATAVSLIPTRSGNGAMEALAAEGLFVPPTMELAEAAFEAALARSRGRVFLDLWDIERLAICKACAPARRQRLGRMNEIQMRVAPVACEACGGNVRGIGEWGNRGIGRGNRELGNRAGPA
jgi:radical SAM enzyme (TIGR01210 family)